MDQQTSKWICYKVNDGSETLATSGDNDDDRNVFLAAANTFLPPQKN